MRARFPGLADEVHILKPIDPSQLEDGDDLFLNVVVAAVLGDEAIMQGRNQNPDRWQALYDSLQKLGTALAGKETQGEGVGLDRLRSFIGNQELVSAVHDFFAKAAALLGKRLLVLPIDDVDTTLHRAFENLEVIRRYLASPALLPIVCGDLRLYHDVTWRDAFRRLTKDIRGFVAETKVTADALAVEYLRKILPLHRRLRMPDVGTFLQDETIKLGTPRDKSNEPRLSLPEFEAWLRALLAGPVNNHENSRLPIPVPTVRALSQLLARVRSEIPAVARAFHNKTAPHPVTDLMRRIVYRGRGEIPQTYRRERTLPSPAKAANNLSLEHWQSVLLDHFRFEPNAGAVCLVLMAARHWRDHPTSSVLATPLFAPLEQIRHPDLRSIETRATLNWQPGLKGRLPDAWVDGLADEAVLPFAVPEVGRAVVSDHWDENFGAIEARFNAPLGSVIVDLITHRNFYSASKRATLVCSGRILELVVTSLVRDVTIQDIERILNSAPFHSAVAVAATKAAHITVDDDSETSSLEDGEAGNEDDFPYENEAHFDFVDNQEDRMRAIESLFLAINHWREKFEVRRLALSPWLVYCALNKALNQAPLFTRPLKLNEQPRKESLHDVVASGLAAFHAFWAAIASFEKGPLFDLPLELSNVNLLNRHGNFRSNNLYTQNIHPLLKDENGTVHGETVISTTWVLEKHPLRGLFTVSLDTAKQIEAEAIASTPEKTDGRTYLLGVLGLPADRSRITVPSIVKALKKNAPQNVSPARYGRSIRREMSEHYPNHPMLRPLDRAIAELVDQAKKVR
ncbi:hypothetical protein C265_22981 [Cupriavidus sp. GA3-3]|nr:hypothetical protein C265_22981 [Cupriavidus sp. GA3-3]